jgi:hypothetical protein
MSDATSSAPYTPPGAGPTPAINTSVPRTLGVLCIVFGALLALYSCFSGVSVALLPLMGTAFKSVQQAVDEDVRKSNERRIESLQARIDESESEAEKDELREQIARMRTMPSPMPDMSGIMEAVSDPLMIRFGMADALKGLVLNVLLFIAGIGLLKLRPWSRKLALLVAALKLALLIGFGAFNIAVVIPRATERMNTMVAEMQAKAAAEGDAPAFPIPPANEAVSYATAGGMIVFGAIFPIILLWLLSKRDVKSAFQRSSGPPAGAAALG